MLDRLYGENMVRTRCEHALDEILEVAEDQSEALRSAGWPWRQRSDLKTLQHWVGVLDGGTSQGVEDSAAGRRQSSKTGEGLEFSGSSPDV